MLLDWPTVIPELAPKEPRFVEIIEIMVWPGIPFSIYVLYAKRDSYRVQRLTRIWLGIFTCIELEGGGGYTVYLRC